MKSFTITIENATNTCTYRINATNIFDAQRCGIDYFIEAYGVGIVRIDIYENK